MTPDEARVPRARIKDAPEATPGLVLHAFITRAWKARDYEDWSAFCSDVVPFHGAPRGGPAGPVLTPLPQPRMLVAEGAAPLSPPDGARGRLRPVRTVSGTFAT